MLNWSSHFRKFGYVVIRVVRVVTLHGVVKIGIVFIRIFRGGGFGGFGTGGAWGYLEAPDLGLAACRSQDLRRDQSEN